MTDGNIDIMHLPLGVDLGASGDLLPVIITDSLTQLGTRFDECFVCVVFSAPWFGPAWLGCGGMPFLMSFIVFGTCISFVVRNGGEVLANTSGDHDAVCMRVCYDVAWLW